MFTTTNDQLIKVIIRLLVSSLPWLFVVDICLLELLSRIKCGGIKINPPKHLLESLGYFLSVCACVCELTRIDLRKIISCLLESPTQSEIKRRPSLFSRAQGGVLCAPKNKKRSTMKSKDREKQNFNSIFLRIN
jgi:hypothetical protein